VREAAGRVKALNQGYCGVKCLWTVKPLPSAGLGEKRRTYMCEVKGKKN
jgi:hypothetical protein